MNLKMSKFCFSAENRENEKFGESQIVSAKILIFPFKDILVKREETSITHARVRLLTLNLKDKCFGLFNR